MKKLSSLKAVFMVCVFCVATATLSLAQDKFTTLIAFDGTYGLYPEMVLTQGADGNFYGTTYAGGFTEDCPHGCGTFFKMTPAGLWATLYNFCSQTDCADGVYPVGSLVQTSNGDFYGATFEGGNSEFCIPAATCGTIFRITPTGTLTTLYTFCALPNCADGEAPYAGLLRGRNGNFYGTTAYGGAYGGGTVFEMAPAGTLTTLYSFCPRPNCVDGDNPTGALVQGTNGNLYGETISGGGYNDGAIFEITPTGKLTTLHSFSNGADGGDPNGGLIQGADGSLYGVTSIVEPNCGSGGYCGTVFKIPPGGELTTLYSFCSAPNCTDGAWPAGPLVQGTDGNFYGATAEGGANNGGTIFEMTPAGTLTTLYNFCSLLGCTGVDPFAGLLQATSGTFYGTTEFGGTFNDGTIFSLSTGLGPFVKTQPTLAKEGATIGIFGQGFNSSSVVQFGGVQATVVKVSRTLLEAKVPAGALTGSVTVTTNGTTLTSNQQFRVLPQLLSFNPPNGPVGTQVTITGVAFTQATAVGFGDKVPAQFTVNSDTQITATVPSGAKTGHIGVVTKGGTAISSGTFTVN